MPENSLTAIIFEVFCFARRFFERFLFGLIFLAPLPVAGQAWPEECAVSVDLLNVRAAPGSNNPVITQLSHGHTVAWWTSEYDAEGDIWHRFPLADGRHGFAAANSMQCNFELTLDQIDPHRTISLYGKIGSGFADRVKRQLSQLSGTPIVILESEGGSVFEAMAAGQHLRNANATVTVNTYCASACLFVLAGGKLRVTNMKAKLGLHRPFLPTRDLTAEERLQILITSRRYLEEMGISPIFADIADAYKGTPIWLSEGQLYELGLISDMVID